MTDMFAARRRATEAARLYCPPGGEPIVIDLCRDNGQWHVSLLSPSTGTPEWLDACRLVAYVGTIDAWHALLGPIPEFVRGARLVVRADGVSVELDDTVPF